MLSYGPMGALSSCQHRIIPEVTLLPAGHQHASSASAQMQMAVVPPCPLSKFLTGQQVDCVSVPQVVLS